ncbi:ABC transporter ATP-binding protein [Gordonia sp. CPCC 205333]|uniref:ABC transporter ATP-binding protein n=1 Tax=Gordonia sp. CPCC 205333 TaxID=3140790 RepID=UPI003AF39239
MTTPDEDARAEAKAQSLALAHMLQPVRTRTRVAMLLQIAASAATVVPFVGVVELGRTLLADGPLNTDRVWAIVLIVAAGLIARAVFSGAALTVTHYADVDLQSILRCRIVEKLGRLPLGWFTRTTSGEVRKAAQHDVGELHYLVAHADVETTAAITTPIFALVYCFALDWRLGLLAIATLPFYALAYAWMMRGAMAQMAKMNAGIAKISATIVEFVSGVAVVKTFGQAGRSHRQFADAADQFNDDFSGYVGPMLRLEAISAMILSAPLVLLVNLSGGYWFVRSGWVTPIESIGATLIAMVLPAALITVSMSMHSRKEAAAAAQRLLALFDERELPVADNPQVPQGNQVEFDAVSFSYRSEVLALQDISLSLPSGSLTALVGPSGSGKSTLATMVPRFHDVDEGSVRIGGVDVRDIAPDELYHHVGFVLQDVSLLGISVGDNIRLGDPTATDADVVRAATAARIHERIEQLPDGYDTVVGEQAQFSGGEAQRVSIARAILADTPILILDEATAFADPESESEIQQALATLITGRTVLVIAHRLGTITHADNIVVLDAGSVAEQGTHDALVASGGVYAGMWRAYQNSDAAEYSDAVAVPIEGVLR